MPESLILLPEMLKRSFFSLRAASIFSNFSLFLELYYVPASGFDEADASTSP